ncbi:hypothetical protein F0267_26070 [Vibrio coralliilyticus]|uniref:hypothetical protein n=1 Tax=Vibrio TaxID=662 RepID=UPI00148E6AC7|nr:MULTISPECIES: hypothetical protein [Vibrio]NOH26182.1 hypothetical protein [Vibrio europaeus]NOH41697.1 hypothetical protein [Vibrio coralliilyticus]
MTTRKKPAAKAAKTDPNAPRDYLVLHTFKFLGIRHLKDGTARLAPSQAAYFLHNGKLGEPK